MEEKNVTDDYKPITMWGYFGYQLLFAIPVLGFICTIVFALKAENKNLQNFARSQFCWLIIVFVLFLISLPTLSPILSFIF